jgi:hypothetical protein
MIAHHGLKLRALFLQFKPVIDRTAFLLSCFAVACSIAVLFGYIEGYGQNAWESFVSFTSISFLLAVLFSACLLVVITVLFFVVALVLWLWPSRIFWRRSLYVIWLCSSLLLLLLLLRYIFKMLT